MKKLLKIKAPIMPNFASYDVPVGLKQNGIDLSKNKFPISEFSKEEALEYAELMKQTFLKHWKKKKMDAMGVTEEDIAMNNDFISMDD